MTGDDDDAEKALLVACFDQFNRETGYLFAIIFLERRKRSDDAFIVVDDNMVEQ